MAGGLSVALREREKLVSSSGTLRMHAELVMTSQLLHQRPLYGRLFAAGWVALVISLPPAASLRGDDAVPANATALVEEAFHHYRGLASYAKMTMTIHRPEWERTQTLEAWTRGDKDSVIVITDPPRDRGNGTLKRGNQMWTFNPRVNRVIKLPPSLMGQSWMGSDFTNHDLARTDSILVDYTHELLDVTESDGLEVYHIRLVPKPDAPVVWGREELLVREDKILLEERFYDQDGRLVKSLVSSEIQMLGGRLLPRVLTMTEADDPERYTRLDYEELEFRKGLPDRLFTEAFLRNPRE